MEIYRLLEDERKRLEKIIREKTAYVDTAPEGTLQCFKVKNSYKWYVLNRKKSDEGITKTRHYISKENVELAERLALKGLYEHELSDLRKELRAINMYLNNCSRFESANRYVENVPEYSRLLAPYFERCVERGNESVRKWLDDTVSVNYRPEGRRFHTKIGIDVRSKTEKDIVNKLADAHIPLKYEQPLDTDIGRFLPDFMVMNPRTCRVYLWEHFGDMSDENYAGNTFEKIAAYYKAGFIPWNNFIMTFEANNSGVDDSWIDAIIENYLI